MKLSQTIINVRLWAVALVLAAAVALAASWGVSDPINGSHLSQYPRADSGDNFFKVVLLPNGQECFTQSASSESVDAEIVRQDPTIWDESFEYVTHERFMLALERALKVLGW